MIFPEETITEKHITEKQCFEVQLQKVVYNSVFMKHNNLIYIEKSKMGRIYMCTLIVLTELRCSANFV